MGELGTYRNEIYGCFNYEYDKWIAATAEHMQVNPTMLASSSEQLGDLIAFLEVHNFIYSHATTWENWQYEAIMNEFYYKENNFVAAVLKETLAKEEVAGIIKDARIDFINDIYLTLNQMMWRYERTYNNEK